MAGTNELAFRDLIARGERAGSVASKVVDAAEAELGVTFPDQYRDFVQRYGAAILPGAEIYGLVERAQNDPPVWVDVRRLTGDLRRQRQAGSENLEYLPVTEDGTGIYFYFNTRAAPNTEIWAVGPGIHRLVSRDFHEFTVKLASGRAVP